MPVEYLIQRPGDLVYVSASTLHAVVNGGVNVAEAVNFGTQLSVIEPSSTICECEDRNRLERDHFKLNLIKNKKIIKSSKETYACKYENCKLIFYKKN